METCVSCGGILFWGAAELCNKCLTKQLNGNQFHAHQPG